MRLHASRVIGIERRQVDGETDSSTPLVPPARCAALPPAQIAPGPGILITQDDIPWPCGTTASGALDAPGAGRRGGHLEKLCGRNWGRFYGAGAGPAG